MDEKHSLDVFVLTGELSGDVLAKDLLKELIPKYRIEGVIGPNLKALGCKEFLPMDSFNFMGFIKPISSLKKIVCSFQKIKKHILKTNPKIVMLVDLPDINLFMAKKLRQKGFTGKIIQVVCPTIWAWRSKRKAILEKYFDHLFCLFPFEKDLFLDSPLKVSYIGHPLKSISVEEEENKKKVLAIFPGSRKQEVEKLLPLFLKASCDFKDHQIHVSVAKSSLLPLIEKIAKDYKVTIRPPEQKDALIKDASVALAKNGTINLELALFHVPQISCYTLSFFEVGVIARIFSLYLSHYSLPNILLKKRVIPELIGPFSTLKNIKKELHNLIYDPYIKNSMKADFRELSSIFKKDSMLSGSSILQSQLCD
jgi:lipid-A-disaccharide synthase